MRGSLCVVAIVTSLACAPEERTERGELAVVRGAPAADPAVGAIVWRRVACEPDQIAIVCSGVLIAPRVLLTAAHCLDLFPGPGAMEVAFGERVDARARFATVIGGARHPKWDRTQRRYDAALLRLAEPIDIPPVRFDAKGPAAEEKGAELRAVGYGVVASKQSETMGARRQGTLLLDTVDDVTFRALPGPSLTCEGDSGGPVFLRRGDRDDMVGVTISGDPRCEQYAGHTRVDVLVEDFIKPFIEKSTTTPVGRPSGSIAPEQLCASRCAEASECPALLPCVSIAGGTGRCQVSEPAGDYGAVCRSNADCGPTATCGRLFSSGADACRCLTPCDAPDRAPTHARVRAGGGGCSAASVRSGDWIVLLGLAAFIARRGIAAGCSRIAPRPGRTDTS